MSDSLSANPSNDTGDSINDPELLSAFFDETGETLAKVANFFVELERSPTDISIVEAIFRPVHSLKGNSAFFGFLGIKRLAHDMETVLDHVRKGRLAVGQELISTLLAGLDGLRAMVDRLMVGGQEVDDQAVLTALMERQRQVAARADGDSSGGDGTRQALATVEAYLIRQANGLDPIVSGAINTLVMRVRADLGIKNPTDTVKAPELVPALIELRAAIAASFQGDPDAAAVTRMGTLVEQLGGFATDDRGRSVCVELLDAWRTCIDAAGYNEIVRDFVAQQVEVLVSLSGFNIAAASPATASPTIPVVTSVVEVKKEIKTDTHHRGEAKTEAKSVRVPESRIDTFLHYVGELLVVGDMFNHLQTRVRQLNGTGLLARDFRRVNDTFAQLSTKLQVAIMSIRKVPIRSHLAKVPRIVRDVAVAKGKEITVEITGEEVEIDKSLVELIDAPLTHMSRNAGDHGIETPAQRLAAGKSREGYVRISIEETSRAVVLTVSDDGAGLNLERIRAKGESLGLVKAGAEMTEKDLINLIFASGLSTAEVVSDVSGRGVGMDVVKRMIDEAGGTINVTTAAGKGTVFRLSLPKGVTTQIVPAFLVRVGTALLALPLERVYETFLLRGQGITNMPPDMRGRPGGRLLLRYDETLPLMLLSDLLGLPPAEDAGTVVTIDSNGQRLALVVSDVIGVRKVVVRNLDGLPITNALYLGGAMMGDGAVALIVNPDALLSQELAHVS
jgi:two-component system, chemotaxis family, sensor kinase CheA